MGYLLSTECFWISRIVWNEKDEGLTMALMIVVTMMQTKRAKTFRLWYSALRRRSSVTGAVVDQPGQDEQAL